MIQPRKSYKLSLPDGRVIGLGERTIVMGIVNVTPDSFSDGGAYLDPAQALDAAVRLEAEGADIIDIGGESTRPGAVALSVTDEVARVLPALERIVGAVRVPVSVDTYKAEVARRALQVGAAIVNDISALSYDPNLADVIAESGAPVVLMHNRGRSNEMYGKAHYDDVVVDVAGELSLAIDRASAAGIRRDQIVVDPGLGFAKKADHTFSMLAGLGALDRLDRPVLVGPSRKSFLTDALGDVSAVEREWGSAAAVTASVLLGAHIVRVHSVRGMSAVVRVADRLRATGEPCPRG